MKYLLSSVLFLLLTNGLFAQLGIQGQYHILHPPVFYTDAVNANENNINQTGVGIDYSFRLKNYRVEFFPTLLYLSGKTTYQTELPQSEKELNLTTLGIQLNTHFYIFDIEGDCNCPTWSKDGEMFKKGFYLSASINGYSTSYESPDFSTDPVLYGAIAVGAGLDIGISPHLTLTPSLQYELQSRKVITPFFSSSNEKTETVSNIMFGLRLGYSFKDH